MAAPTKLTQQLQDDLCKHLEEGNYIQTACALAGIHCAQFYRWQKSHPQFRNAVEKARARAEKDMVELVRDAAKINWQAGAWYLERSYPDRWGRQRQDINLKIIKPSRPVSEMDDAELTEYLASTASLD